MEIIQNSPQARAAYYPKLTESQLILTDVHIQALGEGNCIAFHSKKYKTFITYKDGVDHSDAFIQDLQGIMERYGVSINDSKRLKNAVLFKTDQFQVKAQDLIQTTEILRVRNLPIEEQKPFEAWLAGKARPLLVDTLTKDQDGYSQEDYLQWKKETQPDATRIFTS